MIFRAYFTSFAILLLTACASMGDGSKVEKQQNILQMKEQVLTEFV